MKKYLEFKNEKSSKFWEIEVSGSSHTVRYGKIDTKGQSKTKKFADENAALKDAKKLFASKQKKGYQVPGKEQASNLKQTTATIIPQDDLASGETIQAKGSSNNMYTIKNVGGVYSCSCPAWRNQSKPIDLRTCKHIIKFRGEALEKERIKDGNDIVFTRKKAKNDGPPLLLAHNWQDDLDITSWLMSEKLDGVRAYWDGKKFVSRQGNEFYVPDWFLEGLPSFSLDGEFWAGRKQFQKTVSIVRRFDAGKEWKDITYFIFDAPDENTIFEKRLQKIAEYFKANPSSFVNILKHQACKNSARMKEELERIIAGGGEGLMLRQPGSLYEAGRSTTLLKVKKFYDAEVKVIKHIPGKGKHKGVLGALRVITPEGKEFSVGTGFSDAQRKNPPKIGSIITYSYQELTDSGIPRFPSFVRERTDLS